MQVHFLTLVMVRNQGACDAAKLQGGEVEGSEGKSRAAKLCRMHKLGLCRDSSPLWLCMRNRMHCVWRWRAGL